MKKILRILGLVFLILMLLWTIFPVPALAIDDPDGVQVNGSFVYEDLLEEGDCGIFIDYYIDYSITGNPAETAAEAYLAAFIDIDGSTQLKASAPYVFQDSGYGRGVIWIYFSAAEVTAYGIDSANEALYEVWMVGNPGLTWDNVGPDPPKVTASLDYWQPAGSSAATLLALRVLFYADILELAWTQDLVQETPLGHRLTALGESYFTNVILNLRTIAPSVFASGQFDPEFEVIDYSTIFGATFTNGAAPLGGTATGSPITLVEGANTVDVLTLGTFTIELNQGTIGTAVTDVCVITGSPVSLVKGTNTITTTAPIGDITVTVALDNTQEGIVETIEGTGFDVTEAAAAFGMTRWMFSGSLWLLVTVIACGGLWKKTHSSSSGSTGTFLLFLLFFICGSLLGFLALEVTVVIFIACGIYAGWMMFLKGSSLLDKGIIFFVWCWLICSLAGGIMMAGTSSMASTTLVADIDDDDDTITVVSTLEFPDSGVIAILDERIGYGEKTDTEFKATWSQPMVRGAENTEATSHYAGEQVRTTESSLLNSALSYKIASMADASGVVAFVTIAWGLITGLLKFLILPLTFLSTDLWLITVFWAVLGIGFIASFAISLIGGRRV